MDIFHAIGAVRNDERIRNKENYKEEIKKMHLRLIGLRCIIFVLVILCYLVLIEMSCTFPGPKKRPLLIMPTLYRLKI